MIDIHCHLLPGLDDGAGNFTDALDMATGLQEMGFKSICCTPHLPWDGRRASADQLSKARLDLYARLRKYNLYLDLLPGAEHMITDLPEMLAGDGIIPYPREDALLVEFPLNGFPPGWEQVLFRMQVQELTPVIAHVERYPEVQNDIQVLEKLKERGCQLLVNLTSLGGGWDDKAKGTAREAIQAGFIDAACSDLHTPKELKYVTAGLNQLVVLLGSQGLNRLVSENPENIVGFERYRLGDHK